MVVMETRRSDRPSVTATANGSGPWRDGGDASVPSRYTSACPDVDFIMTGRVPDAPEASRHRGCTFTLLACLGKPSRNTAANTHLRHVASRPSRAPPHPQPHPSATVLQATPSTCFYVQATVAPHHMDCDSRHCDPSAGSCAE